MAFNATYSGTTVGYNHAAVREEAPLPLHSLHSGRLNRCHGSSSRRWQLNHMRRSGLYGSVHLVMLETIYPGYICINGLEMGLSLDYYQ